MVTEGGAVVSWVDYKDLPSEVPTPKEIEELERYRRQRTKARFYADENFPQQAVVILRERGLDVLTAQEAGKRGHPDENQLALARKLHRVLLTCDPDFLDERRFPLHQSSALVVFKFGTLTRAEIVLAFRCLVPILYVPQFYDIWVKIHAKRDEWTQTMRYLDGNTSRERCRLRHGRLQCWVD
jgi:predicted nuclease of predicted toxin-antitoxin system